MQHSLYYMCCAVRCVLKGAGQERGKAPLAVPNSASLGPPCLDLSVLAARIDDLLLVEEAEGPNYLAAVGPRRPTTEPVSRLQLGVPAPLDRWIN